MLMYHLRHHQPVSAPVELLVACSQPHGPHYPHGRACAPRCTASSKPQGSSDVVLVEALLDTTVSCPLPFLVPAPNLRGHALATIKSRHTMSMGPFLLPDGGASMQFLLPVFATGSFGDNETFGAAEGPYLCDMCRNATAGVLEC